MIERMNVKSRVERSWLLNFFQNNFNHDFYYTENNSRIYISDEKSVKKFLSNCHHIFVKRERGEYIGIILVWKSKGGGKSRNYVKLNATGSKVAKDMLTILLWNCFEELYFKIRKDSPFLQAIKYKGFRFHGGRGSQILLRGKSKLQNIKVPYGKNED